MSSAEVPPITQLLHASRGGNKQAFDALIPHVYEQLYRLAGRRLQSEDSRNTLYTTELVHEAYLRLVDADVPWLDRTHFYAVAARVMRHILVDHARARSRDRRGGEIQKISLDEDMQVGAMPPEHLLEIDQALTRLAALDQRKSEVIELLVFGGLTYDEAAGALSISAATLHRELKFARAWLHRELTLGHPEAAGV